MSLGNIEDGGNHLVLSEKIKGVIYEFYRDKKDRHHKT